MTTTPELTITPATTALLLDIDGTLSAVVQDFDDAVVETEVVEAVERARDAFALVAIVTGRTLERARTMVPVTGIWFAAAHGMHIAAPDGDELVDESAAAARSELDTAVVMAQTVGWRYEDKGTSVTLHFRHQENQQIAAQQMRAQVSTVLNPALVELHEARMALEVRPRGSRTKRDAALHILGQSSGIDTAVFVGDDRTDIDGFAGVEQSGLRAIKVAVGSDYAPGELLEMADHVLADQASVLPFLTSHLNR